MDFKRHYYLNTTILVPLGVILFYYLRTIALIPMITLAITYGAKEPDTDQLSKHLKHRNIYYHSLLRPICFMCLSWLFPILILLFAIVGVGFGCHLLGDIRFDKDARKGFYCIKYPWFGTVKTMSGLNTTRWLLLNFLLSLGILALVAGWLLQ